MFFYQIKLDIPSVIHAQDRTMFKIITILASIVGAATFALASRMTSSSAWKKGFEDAHGAADFNFHKEISHPDIIRVTASILTDSAPGYINYDNTLDEFNNQLAFTFGDPYNVCLVKYDTAGDYQAVTKTNVSITGGKLNYLYNMWLNSTNCDDDPTSTTTVSKDAVATYNSTIHCGYETNLTRTATLVTTASDYTTKISTTVFPQAIIELEYVNAADCDSDENPVWYVADAFGVCGAPYDLCNTSYTIMSPNSFQTTVYKDNSCSIINENRYSTFVQGDTCEYTGNDDQFDVDDYDYNVEITYTRQYFQGYSTSGDDDDDDDYRLSKGAFATLIVFVFINLGVGICGGYYAGARSTHHRETTAYQAYDQ